MRFLSCLGTAFLAVGSLSAAACSTPATRPYIGRGQGVDVPDAGNVPDVPPNREGPDVFVGDSSLPSFDSGPPLDIGPIVTQTDPPRPIIGGTLLVTHDGHRAVAADPDRDALFVIDVDNLTRLAEIDLTAGDEPGRAVEDDAGNVHVVLRRAGMIATLDLSTLAITMRRPVCSTPRGIAFDASTHSLEVVCASGEWVSLPAAGGAPTRTLFVEADLRDIVVRTNDVVISTFRTGELRVLARDGTVTGHAAPSDPPVRAPSTPNGPPVDQHEVAWRLIPFHNGSLGLLHQQASTGVISTGMSGYEALGCGDGIAHPAFSTFEADLSATTVSTATSTLGGVLGVDISASPDDSQIAVAFPGNTVARAGRPGVETFLIAVLSGGVRCGSMGLASRTIMTSGQPVALAYLSDGRLLVQNREPATLDVIAATELAPTTSITLSPTSRTDSGHILFHGNAGASIACASCHPEGGDDGHIWNFDAVGARRTHSVRGGILLTAPFHWNGEMTDFGLLAHAVLGDRMGGGAFSSEYADLLAQYVDHIPAMPAAPAPDAVAVDRGRALFQDPTIACAGCHAGSMFTNNLTVDVGTGGSFQVPSLRGVRWRAPYMHNGCAATLRDRFGACGGGEQHGHTAALTPSQIDDLIAYLQTL